MRKSIFFVFLFASILFGQNAEFRATWVITWNHISRGASVESNKARIRSILDDHVTANMNAVLWQVRQSGTAYYESSYEPWGYYAGSRNPGFDPLAYTIEQAHARGLEVHAWVNTFHTSSTAAGAPAAEHPEWVCTNADGRPMTSYRCLSPGLAPVRQYTTDVIREIVQNYDVDGIHLDFIRWNEYDDDDMTDAVSQEQEIRVLDGRFIEQQQLKKILPGTESSRFIYDVEHPANGGIPDGFPSWGEWRRWTVTEQVRMIHAAIQELKPWVRLSVAALGNYNWGGWNGYHTVFQDAALWFNEGMIDQLTPMHYHWISEKQFYSMLVGPAGDSNYIACWGRYIQPGIEAGRLFSTGPGSYVLESYNRMDEHIDIVKKLRTVPWNDGFQFFSQATWLENNYWQHAAETFFYTPTKIRATGLIDDTPPEAPQLSVTMLDTFRYEISVTPADTTEAHWVLVYRSDSPAPSADFDPVHKRLFTRDTVTFIDTILTGTDKEKYYGATAADRFWNESGMSEPYGTVPIPPYSYTPEVIEPNLVMQQDDGIYAEWSPVPEPGLCAGYRVYGKSMDSDWLLLKSEAELPADSTRVLLPDLSLGDWLIRIQAVGKGPKALESLESTPLATGGNEQNRILIVNAFTARNGAWQQPGHPFVARVAESLSRLGYSYASISLNGLDQLLVDPREYDALIWLTGDQGTGEDLITLNDFPYLSGFLRQGGQLLLSGSNIGNNLDEQGSPRSKGFMETYLKTGYVSDGMLGNGYAVQGVDETLFNGVNIALDDGTNGFDVRYPDIYTPVGGSIPCLVYDDGSSVAGLYYEGPVSSATESARIISLGFPFETLADPADMDEFVSAALAAFDFPTRTRVDQGEKIVSGFELYPAYPNPFNSQTTLKFELPHQAQVSLVVYNTQGQQVAVLLQQDTRSAGSHSVTWQIADLASGIYYARFTADDGQYMESRLTKMLYLK
jgi:uncharacterized lipoprotein YddW (UPF0748 family)